MKITRLTRLTRILLILLILSVTINTALGSGLTLEQEEKVKIAYNIGKNIKASDGMTFGFTLPSIMGQESSWGLAIIGDKYDSTGKLKSLYDSSLGIFQIKLSTAKLTILKYPHLFKKYGHLVNQDKSTYKEYEYHYKKLLYYKNIINNPIWIKRYKNGTKQGIATMKWAEKEFLYHHGFYKKYKKQARQDTMLINNLMNNPPFGALIAGHYLLNVYEQALSKGWTGKEAYWRAVGRYNGGWRNKRYFNKVMKRMKTTKKVVKKLRKEGKLK